MEYILLFGEILICVLAFIIVSCILLYYASKFVCYFTKLHLYGYYTNGIYVWKLIQYDRIQVTLYDTKTDTMIVMGRNEFIRDFKFLMSDTLSIDIIPVVEENKE